MPESLTQRSIEISVDAALSDIIGQVRTAIERQTGPTETPVRLAVTKSDGNPWICELGTLVGEPYGTGIFDFNARMHLNEDRFNVVMLVPTGVGAEIGGHAGDATPAAALLASVCDTLITHPNVLNASDIIQVPSNALYVEGSVVSRLMMGTVGLQRTRANRVLVVVQDHEDKVFKNAAFNAVNAARASYGLQVCRAVEIDPSFRMIAEHTPAGTAAGRWRG